MELVIILLALSLLMFVAYRGFSVILFAPICALFAVLLTNPDWVFPFFSNIFMEKMFGFIKAYSRSSSSERFLEKSLRCPVSRSRSQRQSFV